MGFSSHTMASKRVSQPTEKAQALHEWQWQSFKCKTNDTTITSQIKKTRVQSSSTEWQATLNRTIPVVMQTLLMRVPWSPDHLQSTRAKTILKLMRMREKLRHLRLNLVGWLNCHTSYLSSLLFRVHEKEVELDPMHLLRPSYTATRRWKLTKCHGPADGSPGMIYYQLVWMGYILRYYHSVQWVG